MIELNQYQHEYRGICKVKDLKREGMIAASMTDSRKPTFDDWCPEGHKRRKEEWEQ
jgi:hypothetical protein